MAKNQKKVVNYSVYPVRVSVFFDEDGKLSSYKVEKTYKDGKDYKTTNSFFPAELALAAKLIEKALQDNISTVENNF